METDNNKTAELQNLKADPHLWVANYADYLFNYAMSRINNEEEARDLVQETFLAALGRLERFEGRSTERTWLTAIIKNKIIDVYRKKASGLNKVADHFEHDSDNADGFFEPSDGHWQQQYQPKEFGLERYDPLASKEFNHIFQRCMQKLPALWIAVFTMKHMDDEDTGTICAELKVSPSNFWVIIHRAKVNLRECLQKNWI